MKKVFKIILLCTVLLFTVALESKNVYAENSYTVEVYDGIKYHINSSKHEAYVCGYEGNASDVTIPSMVAKGIIVCEIEARAFDGCNTIKVLTIPDTVMSIADTAFLGMDSLQVIVSKAQEVNIVVRENVRIVSDRSEIGSISDGNETGNETGNGDGNGKNDGDNNSSNTSPSAPSSEGKGNSSSSGKIEDVGSVDDGEVETMTPSHENPKLEGNTGGASDTTGNSEFAEEASKNNVNDGNTPEQETGAKTGKMPVAVKVLLVIVGVACVAALAVGGIIFYKKKVR